jgi:hypothetical protein
LSQIHMAFSGNLKFALPLERQTRATAFARLHEVYTPLFFLSN